MPADDFTWKVSYSSNVQEKARNNTVAFGDGYEQNSPDGINSLLVAVDVNIEHAIDTDIAAILALVRARRGVSYFYWTPVIAGYNTQMKFRCDSWRVQPLQYNDSAFSGTFRQVFDL